MKAALAEPDRSPKFGKLHFFSIASERSRSVSSCVPGSDLIPAARATSSSPSTQIAQCNRKGLQNDES
jgi:hypothetical protein